ncbi:MAG: cysteine--tRNA ligase [Candidatus Levybacteria bacterium]|nr:cysteine--tRNA ligase [Candidatus Levybacteria bacterium]
MLKLYNSLSRKIEDFKPLNPPLVTMYTCGPTVYDFAHIGNFRTYTTADLLVRTLQYNNFAVKYVMNLTDVGHLTGDNLGDADTGEDRMEKSAKKEGKTAWEIAEFYTDAFLKDYDLLHLTKPELFVKATDHIKEQIELIKRLEEEGYTYTTSDGVYFDTSRLKDYGKLSSLDQIKEGARVEINPEKRNPRDFALWKFSHPRHSGERSPVPSGTGRSDSRISSVNSEQADSGQALRQAQDAARMTENDETKQRRQMEWDSPWGRGFPGWHIECSAMSLKYLTEAFDPFDKLRSSTLRDEPSGSDSNEVDGKKNYTIDIHVGGIDLRETHHPNEIAQSEAVTGKPFVRYWVHSAFMLVQNERMSKSLGNNYKLYDLIKKSYDPLAMRYLYLQTHYRQEMNFTFPALDGAQKALSHLREEVAGFSEPKIGCAEFEQKFLDAVNSDLNMPEALAIVWELLKSDYPDSAKLQSVLKMDKVLGLDLAKAQQYVGKTMPVSIPAEVQHLINEREKLRKEKRYAQADQLRNKIKKLGFDIEDSKKGTEVKKI